MFYSLTLTLTTQIGKKKKKKYKNNNTAASDTHCFPLCTCPVWCIHQVVNSCDQRGPLPDQPIDPTTPQRHGEYNCTNSYRLYAWLQVWGARRVAGSWGMWEGGGKHCEDPTALAGLICFTQAKCWQPILMHHQYGHPGNEVRAADS